MAGYGADGTWRERISASAINATLYNAGSDRLSLGFAAQARYAGWQPQGGFDVAQHQTNVSEAQGSGQILQFQLRRRSPPPSPRQATTADDAELLDDLAQNDLAQYEEEAPINYRQRMLMNLIAVAIVSALICVGVWIADTIADMQKAQDCIMQGRQNCAPIQMPLKK
jgi:hypothetical protein